MFSPFKAEETCWSSAGTVTLGPQQGVVLDGHGQNHARECAGNPGVWAITCQHRAAWLWFLFASVNMISQLRPLRRCHSDHSYQSVTRLEIMHESSAVFRY